MANNPEQKQIESDYYFFRTREEFVKNCPPGTLINFRGNVVTTLNGEVYDNPNSKRVWLRVGTTKALVPWTEVSAFAPRQSKSFLKTS